METLFAIFGRTLSLVIGAVLLVVAVYFTFQVYDLILELVRDPAVARPRIDSLAETIGADKLTWEPQPPPPPPRPAAPAAASVDGETAPPAPEAPPPPPKPPQPMEFGRAVTMLLYCAVLALLVRIPIALIYAGAWIMTRSFAYGPDQLDARKPARVP